MRVTPQTVPIEFEQTMGCTVADLLRWLPVALPGAEVDAATTLQRARATFVDGTLELNWRPLPSRRLALLEVPCLQVRFTYAGMTAQRRHEVQRRLDLATQRGGG